MKPVIGVMIGACLTGCVSGPAVSARADTMRERLKAVWAPALKCAERELALANAHLTFVEEELEQGAVFRAREHLRIADTQMPAIDLAAARPECQPDADGDGIPDDRDNCVNVPEDLDGYEDADGCPEDQDTDGDKIPDSKDQCPAAPEDYDGDMDDDGCPDAAKDRDGDGIIDPDDQCPAVPEDRDGFQDHDGCPDPDNDQDGIADAADKCPLRPEDKDGFEDLNGCPDPDNDQDRIADTADKCPNQPEDYDGDADTDGCPDVFKRIVVTADRIELKQKVYFATAKSNIRKISFELLDEVAEALQQAPQLRVRIEGHTDSRGSAQYNRKLSEGRAQAVRRYLIERGIASDRLVAVGYGEERPIEDNQTRDGREANRRVEFHIIK
jgi:outer membrane protein OmpA-like peptidoglycan-associated protein